MSTETVYDLRKSEDRRAFADAIRALAKEQGISMTAAAVKLGKRTTLGEPGPPPGLNTSDPKVRLALHTAAMKRVDASHERALRSDGFTKPISFDDALKSVFADLLAGKTLESLS